MKTLFRRALMTAAIALAGASVAQAADPFPTKPVRVIVTSAAGGLLDITTRLVARHMGDKLGQQVVVENRVGAGGLVAIRGMKTVPADGYTLMAAVNTVAIQQVSSLDPGYDLAKDFVGIGPMTYSPFVLVTGPDQPDKNLADMIKRAKANPGKLSYGSAGTGSTTHLAGAMFARAAGLNLLHVPYKGNAAAWPDVVSGRVGMIFEGYASGLSMMRDGRLKAIGVTSPKRMDVLPEVPTFIETGVPDYTFNLWIGLLAPAGTPRDVVQKLSEALHAALNTPEVKDRFREQGSEVVLMSSDKFNQFLKDEVTGLTKLISDLGLPKQ